MGLSNLYLGLGLHEDALLFTEKAKQLDSLLKSARVMEIFANFYLSRWETTVEKCQALLTIDPYNQTALTYLFRSHFQLNQKEKALATLAKLNNPELLGLDLQIALLTEDRKYIQEVLLANNPNLNFTIYTYWGEKDKAAAAYEQDTIDYLNNIGLDSEIQGSYYLDNSNNPHLQAFRGLDWFESCLLYTSDAADDLTRVYLGCRRIVSKKNNNKL